MSKTKNIKDIFPLLSIQDDGLMVSKNGDLCLAFEITYPEIFIQSEQNYETCLDAVFSAIRNLGEGFMIHKQDFFIEDTYEPDFSYINNSDVVLRANETNFNGRPFLDHRGYVYVIYPSSDPTSRSSTSSMVQGAQRGLGKSASVAKRGGIGAVGAAGAAATGVNRAGSTVGGAVSSAGKFGLGASIMAGKAAGGAIKRKFNKS